MRTLYLRCIRKDRTKNIKFTKKIVSVQLKNCSKHHSVHDQKIADHRAASRKNSRCHSNGRGGGSYDNEHVF